MGTSSAYTNLLNLSEMFNDKSTYRELSEIADQAKRRAEVARQGSKQLISPITFLFPQNMGFYTFLVL